MRLRLLLTVSLCCSVFAQEPQDAPAPPVISVTTRLVAVDAVVRDKKSGELNLSLTRDDFRLFEDGHPVPIKYFNRDNDLPLTVGLLVDTSGSERLYFEDERTAAGVFFRDALTQPDDRAFLIRFDSRLQQLQPITGNQQALNNALRLLDYEPDPLMGTWRGGTVLYDAIVTVAEKLLAREHGRHAMLVLTDGDDEGSLHTLDAAITAALAADTAVYSVIFAPTGPGPRHVNADHQTGTDIMQQIARTTGGRCYIAGTGMSTRDIFAAIAADLRTQYRIGFTPASSEPGKRHALELKTVPKNLTVQARTAYYSR